MDFFDILMSFGLLAVAILAIVVFLVAALVSVFTGTGIVRVLSNMFVALFEQYWQYVLVLGILGILGGLSYIWVV
jgi:hypothetical protein